MEALDKTQTLGDVVLSVPGADRVFRSYGVDFCCGGSRTLEEALQEAGAAADQIVAALAANASAGRPDEDGVDVTALSIAGLIDYIVDKHHTFVKRELPAVAELTTTVLRAHGQRHGEALSEVHSLFGQLRIELEQHLIKEEKTLFPLFHDEKYALAEAVMAETESEHDTAGSVLKCLRRVTDDYQVPADGCTTFSLLYQKLEALEGDLFQHIHLENNLLFPQVRRGSAAVR